MNEMDLTMSRRFLYTAFLVGKPSSDQEKVKEIEEYSRNNQSIVRKNVAKLFISDWRIRWNKCKKNRKYFEARFGDWLNQPRFDRVTTAIFTQSTESHVGRRPSDFQIFSTSQKRCRSIELRKAGSEPLTFAASCSLRKDGNFQASKLIQEAVVSPQRVGKILSAYKEKIKDNIAGKMSNDQALALATDCGFTTYQYLMLRKNSKKLGADLYPNYHKLLEQKHAVIQRR